MFFLTAKNTKGLRKGREGFFANIFAFFALFFFVLVSAGFFTGCAQMLIPNGGPKDDSVPRVVRAIPANASVDFKGKEIRIVFNEYIQLKDVNNQLIISPPLEEQPEIKLIKYKTLSITFKKPLKENTTYTMNFGSAIADYNESNVLDNFQYVFSTGSFIDSLSLSGKVAYAFDHKTEKGILVMLYDDLSDSAPYKVLPSYFTKTKPDGSYTINNIRAGKYKVFALKDENRNYKYDAAALEVIGFADQPVEISKNASVDLELFRELPSTLKLKSKTVLGYGHILFILNKAADHVSVKALNVSSIPTEILEFSKQKDSLDYWFEGVATDSLKLQLLENTVPFDTVNVRLMTKENMNKSSKGEKLKLNVTTNLIEGQKLDLDRDVLFRFNNPVISTDPLRFRMLIDSGLIKKNSSETKVFHYHTASLDQKEFRIAKLKGELMDALVSKNINTGTWDSVFVPVSGPKWQEDHSYEYLIKPGFFTDIFGSKNDSIKIKFKTQEQKYYGTLKLKFKAPKKGYVLQLLDAKETVLKEEYVSDSKDFYYDYLVPGSYKLKVIVESKSDNKWNTGNYLSKTQPEKVIYYSQPITVRSNWDLDVEWKVLE